MAVENGGERMSPTKKSGRHPGAVLFDLDGTLNALEHEQFMPAYLDAVERRVADLLSPGEAAHAILSALEAALADPRQQRTVAEKFRRALLPHNPPLRRALLTRLEAFHEQHFHQLRALAPGHPQARAVVDAVRSMGWRVVVATNPIFPEVAIRQRLAWAGLGDVPFDLITTMETMHACKPHLAYYEEICRRLGVEPAACVMVGNDREQDMVAAQLGMGTYWVVEHAIDRGASQLEPDGAGSLAELPRWLLAATPTCLPPAPGSFSPRRSADPAAR